ncbi:MAG TPA: glutathione S-transferase [Burkholderiaceae bacterium]|nr:glutathione S-transferase [Burkholderiaceae bacterium]
MTTLRLFIANKNYSSWSLRPWLLLSQLQIPFEERLVAFSEGSSWSAFRGFSPTGKVPCLHDGERVIWDSMAIAEYVAESDPHVWPADADARAWARCASAEMHAGFGMLRARCPMNVALRVRLAAIEPALAQDLRRIDELWLDGLTRFGGPFLAGPAFSAVDAFFAPVAFRIQTYGLSLSAAALAYADLLRQLPAARRWERAALEEPWRDAAHEAEVRATGAVLQDLRDR